MIWQRPKDVDVGNHEYIETDSIHSVQSSLKSHPFWMTLCRLASDYINFLAYLHSFIGHLHTIGGKSGWGWGCPPPPQVIERPEGLGLSPCDMLHK